ncbi:MAG: family 16 glycosylhydrolase [Bacteroidota bacterium]
MKNFLFMLGLSILMLSWSCKQDPEGPQDETLPFLGIQNATLIEGNANSTLSFELRLSTAFSRDVTLNYRTQDGTATAGEDYVGVSGANLVIPAGETRAAIAIEVLGDEEVERDETLTVILSEVTNAQISNEEATGTIRNDDESDGSVGDLGYTTPTSYAGYTLVWQEEFDDSSIGNDWIFEQGDGCPNLCGWGNNELQTYTNRPDNVYLTEGKLVIEAKRESFNGASYTSTRMITKGKQSFQYGRIDVRAKLPFGQGIWPAIWMLGDNIDQVGWPNCGEIDIMELVGHEPQTVHGTVHWGDENGNRAQFGDSYSLDSGIFNDEFHVFSIIWEEDRIIWYTDDVQYHVINTSSSELDEFRNRFFFILNIAVGGNWPGNPDGTTTFPQKMAVDYIRVFQVE